MKVVTPLQTQLFEAFDLHGTAQKAQANVSKRELDQAGYYATLLQFFAHEAPQFAGIFHKAANRIRKQAARTVDDDHRAVLAALNHQMCKVPEIASHANLSEVTTYKILKRLHNAGLITRTPAVKDEGRGGDKRSFLYWPIA